MHRVVCEEQKSRGKEGIALVLVLGFLSILIMLALAFAVSMRTERLASEVAKDSVQTRNLAHAALAAAMGEVDWFLRDWKASPVEIEAAAGTARPVNVHPPKKWSIIESLATEAPYEALGSSSILLQGEVTNWIPGRYLTSADIDYNARIKAQSAQWKYVRGTGDYAGRGYIGRYAYLCFDCTGLIDINQIGAGAGTVREQGESMREVDVSLLPEVTDVSNFEANRSFFHHFGTFAEVRNLNHAGGGNSNAVDAISPSQLQHFSPYSLSYDWGWWDWTSSQFRREYGASGSWSIDLCITNWDINDARHYYEHVIKVADSALVDELAACFVDYVDEDYLPGGKVGSPDVPNAGIVCGEPIPMINEIGAKHEIIDNWPGSPTLTYRHYVDVELWYPFPANTGNTRTYQVNITNITFTFRVAMVTSGGDIERDQDDFPVTLAVPDPAALAACVPQITVSADVPFYMASVMYEHTIDYSAALDDPGESPVQFIVNSDLANMGSELVDTSPDGGIVDSVNPGPSFSFTPVRFNAGATAQPDEFKSTSVNDPRWNHLGSEWDTPSSTMLAIRADDGVFKYSLNGGVEGIDLYVRNSNYFSSVAEMGFLLSTGAWTSIDLFSNEGRDTLAIFRVNTNLGTVGSPVKLWTNGFVNPNSTYPEVFKAVFVDAPIDEYIGMVNPPVFDDVDAVEGLALDIVARSEDDTYWGADSFYSGAGWVIVDALQPNGLLDVSYNLNNSQREAIIRNSYQLFSANQNVLTFVVVAQSINDQGVVGDWEPDEDTITGEEKIVALVWRDPFPEGDICDMHIRNFRYVY